MKALYLVNQKWEKKIYLDVSSLAQFHASYFICIESFEMHVLSQYFPVLCILHPSSHIPVDVLQGASSLQIPWHLTHDPFEIYDPLLQTVKVRQLNWYINITFHMKDFKIVTVVCLSIKTQSLINISINSISMV